MIDLFSQALLIFLDGRFPSIKFSSFFSSSYGCGSIGVCPSDLPLLLPLPVSFLGKSLFLTDFLPPKDLRTFYFPGSGPLRVSMFLFLLH